MRYIYFGYVFPLPLLLSIALVPISVPIPPLRAHNLFRSERFIYTYLLILFVFSFLMDSIRIHQRLPSISSLSRLPHRIRNSIRWQIIPFVEPRVRRIRGWWLGCESSLSSFIVVLSLYIPYFGFGKWKAVFWLACERRPPYIRIDTVNVISSSQPHSTHPNTHTDDTQYAHTIAVSVFNRPFDFWPVRFVVCRRLDRRLGACVKET